MSDEPTSNVKPKITITTRKDQDKDKDKDTGKEVIEKVEESVKKVAGPSTGDANQDALALAAGVSMMNDFQKSLFPYMVKNIEQFIEVEDVTLEDSKNTTVTRHKINTKESLQIDRWEMGEDLPNPIPPPHTRYTWILMKKMEINYGFTEDLFWDTPLEQMEFLIQLSVLKRQGFRRDKPKLKPNI